MPIKLSHKLCCLVSLFFVFALGANADTLGQGQQFFVSPQYDSSSRASVNATLRHISERAYFYVEDKYWSELNSAAQQERLNQIRDLAVEFDTKIYPTETGFYGSEPNPGLDGDPRVTILLSPLIQNAGGYYDTANQHPRERVPESNERDMVYLNVASLSDKKKIYAFLAHEFQHLISFNQQNQLRKIEDDIWLNELRSEYAVMLGGYNNELAGSHLERRIDAFLKNPSDSMTEWKNLPPDYAQILLFSEFLAEHWSPRVIADTLKTGLISIQSINAALAANGFKDTFFDVFVRWIVANFLNNQDIDPRFGYTNQYLKDLRPNATRVFGGLADNVRIAITENIKDWEARWYDAKDFAPGNNSVLEIDFSSPSLTSFVVPYFVFRDDGDVSWSVFYPDFRSHVLKINDVGKGVNRVAFSPVKKDKLSGFSSNESAIPLTFSLERVASVAYAPVPTNLVTVQKSASSSLGFIPNSKFQIQNSKFPSGSLLRASGDLKVYVINSNYRRHIISPTIFNFYPHLGFDKVQVVAPEVLAQYKESRLVRYPGSQRVFEVDSSGTRRWLNMSGEQFIASGRGFDSVFLVNDRELRFYKLGANIKP